MAKPTIVSTRAGDATNYPKAGATCRIHYEARLPDNTLFDSSRARARPLLFKVGCGQLIPGLDMAVTTMSVGQIARITVPPSLAYGDTGYLLVVTPNTQLTYDVELIDFNLDDDNVPKSDASGL